MVVDTSALAAILFREPDADRYAQRLADVPKARISAVSYVELGMITASSRGLARDELDRWLVAVGVATDAVDDRQARLALEAFLTYGKGRHPACLNICDCFAYALAKHRREPLLFKGNDFARTDIASALPPSPG